MIQTAERLGNVKEYYFSKKLREIAALKAQGKNILNLGIGSPDQMPDETVIAKLNEAAANPKNHGYQSYKGIPELRIAFSGWYKKHFNVALDPETEILPLIGSKEGIFHIAMTYLNDGDQVLVPNPGYPTYAAASKLAGAQLTYYDLNAESNWLPDLDKLNAQDLSRVKIMWVNYPNMPTGKKADSAFFEELIAFAAQNNILLCNDNPYAFILNNEPCSLLASGVHEHVIELNSLSKSHNMAGWRIGMLGACKEHVDNVLRFKSNLDSGMFLPTQLAGAQALGLSDAWYENLNSEYRRRRLLAADLLKLLGCEYDDNQVGLFIWAKVPTQVTNVEEWMDEILYGAEIFITPGFVFGSNGARYIRISLCSTQEDFELAISRVSKFLAA